ncbi:DUF4177 domain-containing protein [candidate division WOR-3 bacterium]|nr:DUF4177 domain-containing protein [candidate division WOR-3 bacterium]
MTKWEYQMVTIEIHLSPVLTMARMGVQRPGDKRPRPGQPEIEKYLCELGAEGWELAGTAHGTDNHGTITKVVLFMKRPLAG